MVGVCIGRRPEYKISVDLRSFFMMSAHIGRRPEYKIKKIVAVLLRQMLLRKPDKMLR